MRLYAIRFSDGSLGRLISRDDAVRALESVDPVRRPLCELTCWEEVADPTAETMRPSPPVEPEPINLNCKHCGQRPDSHGYCGAFRPCHEAYRKSYEPINPGPREPMATLDEVPR